VKKKRYKKKPQRGFFDTIIDELTDTLHDALYGRVKPEQVQQPEPAGAVTIEGKVTSKMREFFMQRRPAKVEILIGQSEEQILEMSKQWKKPQGAEDIKCRAGMMKNYYAAVISYKLKNN